MKKTIVMLIIASIVLLSSLGMKTAHAQGDAEIIVMVQNDAACVSTNETFKVYVKVLNLSTCLVCNSCWNLMPTEFRL